MTQRTLAGAPGIAFGALTIAAVTLMAAPGGGYSVSVVDSFLAPGHRAAAIAALLCGLLGVTGLVGLLTHLRGEAGGRGPIVWGVGLAGAASIAAGFAVLAGLVFADWEGGAAVAVPPTITYVISEVAVVLIFGAGAMLVGIALIAAATAAGVRWAMLLAGVCGVAGLAYFPFFLLLLWAIGFGIRLAAQAPAASGSLPSQVSRSPMPL
jgi:hypothetical protein